MFCGARVGVVPTPNYRTIATCRPLTAISPRTPRRQHHEGKHTNPILSNATNYCKILFVRQFIDLRSLQIMHCDVSFKQNRIVGWITYESGISLMAPFLLNHRMPRSRLPIMLYITSIGKSKLRRVKKSDVDVDAFVDDAILKHRGKKNINDIIVLSCFLFYWSGIYCRYHPCGESITWPQKKSAICTVSCLKRYPLLGDNHFKLILSNRLVFEKNELYFPILTAPLIATISLAWLITNVFYTNASCAITYNCMRKRLPSNFIYGFMKPIHGPFCEEVESRLDVVGVVQEMPSAVFCSLLAGISAVIEIHYSIDFNHLDWSEKWSWAANPNDLTQLFRKQHSLKSPRFPLVIDSVDQAPENLPPRRRDLTIERGLEVSVSTLYIEGHLNIDSSMSDVTTE
ncbi:hypothetical protein DICVIV_01789 [Dictyocaulus viviparus]|uniref:Uncharacterized protein n=1 Tax=Dictyocaulus viviparus TaxID=29172 RepID=A0A0D8Y7A5_DICVI|nr:hypothetical protein DICVIV_01789 [Dictyocaulus viviparus]